MTEGKDEHPYHDSSLETDALFSGTEKYYESGSLLQEETKKLFRYFCYLCVFSAFAIFLFLLLLRAEGAKVRAWKKDAAAVIHGDKEQIELFKKLHGERR